MRANTTLLATTLAAALLTTAVAARPIDETVPLSAKGTVRVSNLAGSIKIVGGRGTDVHVTGTADEKVKEVSIDARGDEVEIEVVLDDHIRGNGGQADLVIHVPSDARVEVETVSASIDVDGVRGAHELSSVSGDIGVRGGAKSPEDAVVAEIESVSGAIDVEGWVGRVETSSVSGATTLRGINGAIEAQTTSGAIDVVDSDAEHVECTSVSGTLRFAGAPKKDAELTFENFSGSVELALPSDLDAELEVTTFSGGIDSAHGGEVERPEFGPGSSLAETFGDGSARISVNTFSGPVSIEKQGGSRAKSSEGSKSAKGSKRK